MNYHFLSFLLDVVVWIGFSVALARYISGIEHYSQEKAFKNGIVLALTALCTGCWAVLTTGLPDVGFFWQGFFLVVLVTSIHALLFSPVLRRKYRQLQVMLFVYIYQVIKLVKGGVIYVNSR